MPVSVDSFKKARQPKRLSPGKTVLTVEEGNFTFQSTADLTPLNRIVGQDKAVDAIKLGLGIDSIGYNIFICGLTGSGRTTTIKTLLERVELGEETPDDWIYVNNFKDSDCPKAVSMRAGDGEKFKRDMEDFVENLKVEIPRALEKGKAEEKKEEVMELFRKKQEQLMAGLNREARKRKLMIGRSSSGELLFIPVIDGKPAESEEDLQKLTKKQLEAINRKKNELIKVFNSFNRREMELKKTLAEQLSSLEKNIALSIIKPMIEMLKEKYSHESIGEYLDEAAENLLENLDVFKGSERKENPFAMMQKDERNSRDAFLPYRINVVVNNARQKGPPIIIENIPTYANLFGSVEKVVDQHGRLVTDFTKIKAGSILKANGGYLIFNIEDALTEIGVWRGLKRVMKTREIKTQIYDPYTMFSYSNIKPDPIPIDMKIIAIGNLSIYHLLYRYDGDFKKIFKIKADFDNVMKSNRRNYSHYARFIAKICDSEGLLPFDRSGVAAVIEYGIRRSGNQKKLSVRFGEIADIIRESHYWARMAKAGTVDRSFVEKAKREKTNRCNLLEEKIQEMIEEGKVMIDVKGEVVGQVNGLAVFDLGDFAFGKPARITAKISMGRAGIVNIEREADMSGKVHNKGVLILTGYLRSNFALDKPLSLSASLCFEQSYNGVDGDSASSTELYALLSALSELPVDQGIAVTGSINQKGEVQPIGGVNYKIEGFYDVCKAKKLTGTQGVIIPVQNVDDLMLRKDVVQDIEKGLFHIYPVASVEKGIEILTGVKAGSIREKGTVFHTVNERLKGLAIGLKEFGTPEKTPEKAGSKSKGKSNTSN
jgi:ATP-dependent Lon protease